MGPIAATERLVLREMDQKDAEHAYMLNKDPEVLRYTGDDPFGSVDAAREFLSNYGDYRRNGFGRWAVERKADGVFLGWCGLKLNTNGEVDLGYRLARAFWGMGYATEAGRACIRLGFDRFNLDTIIGRTAKKNLRSIRVLEKLGMSYWKTDVCEHDPEALYYRIFRSEMA